MLARERPGRGIEHRSRATRRRAGRHGSCGAPGPPVLAHLRAPRRDARVILDRVARRIVWRGSARVEEASTRAALNASSTRPTERRRSDSRRLAARRWFTAGRVNKIDSVSVLTHPGGRGDERREWRRRWIDGARVAGRRMADQGRGVRADAGGSAARGVERLEPRGVLERADRGDRRRGPARVPRAAARLGWLERVASRARREGNEEEARSAHPDVRRSADPPDAVPRRDLPRAAVRHVAAGDLHRALDAW